MDLQQKDYDTITVMNNYDFHKPINVSIIYEDHEEDQTFYNSHKDEFVLVNKMADILCSIKQALGYYCEVITRCKNKKRKGRLRRHWLHVKHKLFDEFSAVSKEFLLQNRLTDQFIKDILSNTEQIFKAPITYNLVSSIHETLLKWIELKQIAMKNFLSEISPNCRRFPQITHRHLSSQHVINDSHVPNIISSGSLGSKLILGFDPETSSRRQNIYNKVNSTLLSSCNMEERTDTRNTGRYLIPHSNYFSNGASEQQIMTPSAQINAIAPTGIYYNEPQVIMTDRVCYTVTHIDNTILPQNDLTNADDTTRSSISRDSGFISLVTPVSYLPVMMPIQDNIINNV